MTRASLLKLKESSGACEYQSRGSTDVSLFRSSAPGFAVEGGGSALVRLGVLLKGMVRIATPSGLAVNDARESPRVFVLPAGVPYAITAVPGHTPVIVGAAIEQRAAARYIGEESRGARGDVPILLEDPVTALGLQAFHRSMWSGASPLEWESWLLTSLRRLFGEGVAAGRPAAFAEPRGVARAREYLHEHYRDSISLEQLAVIAGMSKYHLVRTFRAAAGVPPHMYQRCLRLTRSLFMLRQGVPLSAVAHELGFADQSHFTRAFRAEYGTTPGAWLRALGRPKDPGPPEGSRPSGERRVFSFL
jgi:AraC-like DNA-binding protein